MLHKTQHSNLVVSNTNRHSLTVLRMDKLSWVFLTWDPSHSYSEMVAEAGVFWNLSYLHDWLLGWEGWNSWGLAPHLFLTGAFPHGWVGFLHSQTFYVVAGLPHWVFQGLMQVFFWPSLGSHSVTSTTFC